MGFGQFGQVWSGLVGYLRRAVLGRAVAGRLSPADQHARAIDKARQIERLEDGHDPIALQV